jgi:hypothetical protein
MRSSPRGTLRPLTPEEALIDTLNGYLPLPECIPAAEEVLSALRFYDREAQR